MSSLRKCDEGELFLFEMLPFQGFQGTFPTDLVEFFLRISRTFLTSYFYFFSEVLELCFQFHNVTSSEKNLEQISKI
jgi:hypothetical protein